MRGQIVAFGLDPLTLIIDRGEGPFGFSHRRLSLAGTSFRGHDVARTCLSKLIVWLLHNRLLRARPTVFDAYGGRCDHTREINRFESG